MHVCVCVPCVRRVCALFEFVHTYKNVCVSVWLAFSERALHLCVCVQNRGLSAVYETMPKITHTPHSTQPPLRWPCLITGNERGRGMDGKGKGEGAGCNRCNRINLHQIWTAEIKKK